MPRGYPHDDPYNEHRQPKAGPARGAPGSHPRAGRRQIMIGLDTDMIEEIHSMALQANSSFAHQVRCILTWGLETLEGDNDE